ncbi:MAG: GYD domain-containing protein [Desulfobacteraceae bacterium]|jgi:uncharacterized protein with GYD domain
MLWVSYGKLTNESIQGLVSNPQNRAEAVAKLVDAYGGEMVSYHMLLNGDFDFIIFSEIPDDKIKDLTLVNALIVRGAGGVESLTTVPAIKADDAMLQMQKAQKLSSAMAYRAPTQP